MSEFRFKMQTLGPEYTVSALAVEFMDRFLNKDRKTIIQYVTENASYSHLNEFARLVRTYIEDNLKSSYSEYLDVVTEVLDGDKTNQQDLDKADQIFMSALKEHHLVKWYKTTK